MSKRALRRQLFVLTLEEKKAIGCVLGALLLGLATQHYRAQHPPLAPSLTAKAELASRRAARSTAARARSARGQKAVATGKPTPLPEIND